VTRLTILKGLCQEQAVAYRFVIYLARKTLEHVRQGKGRFSHPDNDAQRFHRKLMTDALEAMETWLQNQDEVGKARLRDLLTR
jgi:hypothetical protein